MRRVLLGTSAICAVAATAGPAFAQGANEPLRLGITGHFLNAYGGMITQSGAAQNGVRSDDLLFDNIVDFTGSTKLDNGLTIGGHIQMRAQNNPVSAAKSPTLSVTSPAPDTIKRQWAFFRGSFGEFQIGDHDDARRRLAFAAPEANGGTLWGANSPQFVFGNAAVTNTTSRALSVTSRVSRLMYFTPTIAGFSFGATYAPGGEKGGDEFSNTPGLTPDKGVNVINNEWSLAGNYSGKFGSFGVDAFAGYTQGHRVSVNPLFSGSNDPAAADGGLTVSFAGIKVGGTYEKVWNPSVPLGVGGSRIENNTWNVGASYDIGPLSVGLDWTRGLYDNAFVAGSTTRVDWIVLGAGYTLGPGIIIGAAANWSHNTAIANGAYTGSSIMAGSSINF